MKPFFSHTVHPVKKTILYFIRDTYIRILLKKFTAQLITS